MTIKGNFTMGDQQFEPESQIHWKMLRKEIPENSHQLFLPLYLFHPAALKLRGYGIFMSGISKVDEGFRITRNADFHVVIFTLNGQGVFRTADGAENRIGPGTVTLIPAGLEHDYVPEPGEPWNFFWFHLVNAPIWDFLRMVKRQLTGRFHAGELLQDALNGFVAEINPFSLNHPSGEIPYFYIDSPQLDKSMQEFSFPVRNSTRKDAELVELYAELIWRHLQRELRILAGTDKDLSVESQKLDSLWKEIARKPELPWTLPELAGKMNMSVSTFLRYIRRVYNRTPQNIVTHIRMRKAAQFLLETELPVMAIATKVGYESTSSFVTVFRRNFKCTPLSYRKRNAGGS